VTLKRPENHPRRTVLALRATLASGDLARATRALFDAYWREGRDLEDAQVVRAALDAAGLDGARAVERAGTDEIKAELFARTAQAVERGVFGAPSFWVEGPRDSGLFFGWDRLDQVERALAPTRTVEVYFDYASPFAYLAATQLPSLLGATGARLELRPILLGGLFKAIGTPNVPLFEMPAAKRAHQAVELDRWARRWGVPFRFTSRFPMNTVKPLRLTLIAPAVRRLDLALAIFRALWTEDRDVSNDEVLVELCAGLGLDGAALVGALGDDSAKELLRGATAAAEARGVFGVPTFFVGDQMFWGQDRVDWVRDALIAADPGM
jgi:2-hydroxychromene-2-carboxylate isomerase